METVVKILMIFVVLWGLLTFAFDQAMRYLP